MPEKKASVSFDALMRQLKNGEYAPVYLLMGDEPYYIDKLSNFFQNKILTPEQQAFDLTVVFGADVNAAQIADLAMQYPMTAPRKVIIVNLINLRNMCSIRNQKQFSSSAIKMVR